MNTRLTRFLTAGLLALSSLLPAARSQEDPVDTCPVYGLRIAEIGYLPVEDGLQFIELINFGENAIDARAAEVLTGGDLRIQMNAGLPASMPSGARIVIYLAADGVTFPDNDLSFSEDNLVVFNVPGTLAEIDSLALYRRIVGTEYLPTDLLQYVAWGDPAPASPRRDAAILVGLWPSAEHFILTRTDQGLEDFGTSFRAMRNGGALVWNGLSDTGWFVETPGRSTPGTTPLTTPVTPLLLYPNNVEVDLDATNTYAFHFGIVPWATQYEVQVETSTETWVGATVTGDRAWLTLTLTPGNTYSWRVRAVSASGDSGWTTSTFSVVDPTASAPGLESLILPGDASAKPTPPRVRAGTFSGTIRDARSGNGLGAAVVTVTPVAGGAPVVTATAANGTFATAAVADGDYVVRVTRANYGEVSGNFTIAGAGQVLNGRLLGNSRAVANGGRGIVPFGAYKETTALAVPSPANPDQVRTYRRNVAAEWQGTTNALTNLTYMWCWAVSSRMINRFYGGDITNDQVVFHVKSNRYLIGLIDGVVNGASGGTKAECNTALTYALNGGAVTDVTARPTEAQMVAYIDGNQPLYFWAGWADGANGYAGAHIMTIRAYRWVDGQLQIELVNYDNNARLVWVNWTNGVPVNAVGAAAGTPVFRFVFVPAADATARARNDALHTDTDGDGVLDYDESTRWPALFGAANGLAANNVDSDADSIQDKVEITAWARTNTDSLDVAAYPDIDRDGLFPERDEDTDNGGLKDGEEDKDFNGTLNGDETRVFKADDDGLLDIVFLIDTTGSMGPYINNVKSRAVEIVNLLQTTSRGFRVAVVDYRDFASRGGSQDYPARTRISFSSDVTAIIAAINGLNLGFGGDFPETVYSGIVHSLDGNAGAWRRNSKRAIIVMGDAPPLDPEPFTGYTSASVIARLLAGGVTAIPGGVSLDPKSLPRGAGGVGALVDDSGLSGSVSLFVIPNTSSLNLAEMVSATGGQTITGVAAGEAFLTAIRAIQQAPAAALALPGVTPGATTITADARGSVDFTGCGIVLYEWDWNGDGVFDETTVTPVVTHTYPTGGFTGTVRLRVTDAKSGTGTTAFVLETAPTIIEVTDLLDEASVSWTLDRQTGHLNGTVTIGPRGVPLSTGLWIAVTGEGFELETEDGATPDGRGYVDLTDEFLAAVRAVGNLDAVLDPTETVSFSPLRILSGDRSAPLPSLLGYFSSTSGVVVPPDDEEPPPEEDEEFSSSVGIASVSAAAPATIANLSARAVHGSGARAVIPGFVIRGTETRRMLVRAAGPGLADFGIEGTLANPALRIFRTEGGASVPVAANDDWSGDDVAAASYAAGAFPFAPGSGDAALVADLAPGHYTAVVDAPSEGVTLVEVYGLDAGAANAELVNVSARTHVGAGECIAIAGVVVRGDAPRQFLVRAVGPTLGLPPFGLPGVLAQPVVTVYAGSEVIATNAGWNGDSAVAQAAATVGAFPLAVSGADAALVITLAPGAYTVQVGGLGGAEGVALVEVYALD